jgi:hypothetical protein
MPDPYPPLSSTPANTAMNSNNGQTIRLLGGGVFDTSLRSVAATGDFQIKNAQGTVISRGHWAATAFSSFDPQGGPNPGLQGGLLKIYVTLHPTSGAAVTNQLMTVLCPFESGAFDEGDDGTTLGNFTNIIGGITVFHLLKP